MTPNKTHTWVLDVAYQNADSNSEELDLSHTHACSKCSIVKMLCLDMHGSSWWWSYRDDDDWRGPVSLKKVRDFGGEPIPTCSEVVMKDALE